jgi:hypothetical protein
MSFENLPMDILSEVILPSLDRHTLKAAALTTRTLNALVALPRFHRTIRIYLGYGVVSDAQLARLKVVRWHRVHRVKLYAHPSITLASVFEEHLASLLSTGALNVANVDIVELHGAHFGVCVAEICATFKAARAVHVLDCHHTVCVVKVEVEQPDPAGTRPANAVVDNVDDGLIAKEGDEMVDDASNDDDINEEELVTLHKLRIAYSDMSPNESRVVDVSGLISNTLDVVGNSVTLKGVAKVGILTVHTTLSPSQLERKLLSLGCDKLAISCCKVDVLVYHIFTMPHGDMVREWPPIDVEFDGLYSTHSPAGAYFLEWRNAVDALDSAKQQAAPSCPIAPGTITPCFFFRKDTDSCQCVPLRRETIVKRVELVSVVP